MEHRLDGKKVAILVAEGFEEVELTEPRKALQEAGAQTTLISPNEGTVRGWAKTDWGEEIPVELPLSQARAEDFDALLLPGGVMNPDHLRTEPDAVKFTRDFASAGKPIASICHGPWLLVEAETRIGTIGRWCRDGSYEVNEDGHADRFRANAQICSAMTTDVWFQEPALPHFECMPPRNTAVTPEAID